MNVIYGLENLSSEWDECTVSIGVFDGVHLGHQKVIQTAYEDSRKHSRTCVVLTFDRHPMSVVKPEYTPETILSPELKNRKIIKSGADFVVIVCFNKEFASQSPNEFYENVLYKRLKAKTVVVGYDFQFGKDRQGNTEWLSKRITTHVVPPIELEGKRVSSTEVRSLIKQGAVKQAGKLLGEDFGISGMIVKGNQLGRKMEMPTINLVPIINQIIPKSGVYSGSAETTHGLFGAAISIGTRPSIEGAGFAIEAHLIDFPNLELYGSICNLFVSDFVREQISFNSLDELSLQMKKDVELIRKQLETTHA